MKMSFEMLHCQSIVIVNHKHHIVFLNATGFLSGNFQTSVLDVIGIPSGTKQETYHGNYVTEDKPVTLLER
jgi:hypothetical protein